MLWHLELGDGVVDFIGLDEELKRSGDSISGKEEKVSNKYNHSASVIKYGRKYSTSTIYVAKRIISGEPKDGLVLMEDFAYSF